jgi:hypothetical protein
LGFAWVSLTASRLKEAALRLAQPSSAGRRLFRANNSQRGCVGQLTASRLKDCDTAATHPLKRGKEENNFQVFTPRSILFALVLSAEVKTGLKLACIVYHLLKTKEPYRDINRLLYEEKIRRHRVKKLRKQAAELGFQIIETQVAA